MTANLFGSNYFSGLFYFSPSKLSNHPNFVKKIINNRMVNNMENNIKDTFLNFSDTLENKIFNYTNNIVYKTIFSTYDIYTNLINNRTKTITEKDIIKYNEFEKNKYSKESIIEVIDKLKIFANETNVNVKNEIRLSKIIEKDVDNSLSKIIKDAINVDKDEKTDEKVYDDDDDDDEGVSYNIDIIYSDERVSLKGCYNVDIIKKYTGDLLPININCPKYPILKLVIDPVANYSLCFQTDYQTNNRTLAFDFYCEANAGLDAKLGVSLDVKLVKVDFDVGMDKVLLTGKVGIKFSIDFMEERLMLNLYCYFSGGKFQFYLIGKVKLLWKEFELFNYRPKFDLKKIKLDKPFIYYLRTNEFVSESLIKEFEYI
jgi:hypothetical protein